MGKLGDWIDQVNLAFSVPFDEVGVETIKMYYCIGFITGVIACATCYSLYQSR